MPPIIIKCNQNTLGDFLFRFMKKDANTSKIMIV